MRMKLVAPAFALLMAAAIASAHTFGEYIDMIEKGPAAWRLFLFNIFDHAPQLIQDFSWPEDYMKGFVKKYPMERV